ncbi:glycoside hydrolase family 53 protein [Aaosphaeria arxii CBS 175.79]|uniref:Arabinogalactan endo-beta-1,4-galactanase n=1 Tax=Aaosphaeria arxii CBS 175.79 TaxID=1450172 RepID=A0A6A5X878_9PLEO|nr:glycoside hydrolase family 53 protein [Aaosphaeria arxii CBS 175.79]KAF2009099.1 glycoside hydrolase family 53 protein [Aaosphaeria arxii CBS 175.79]
MGNSNIGNDVQRSDYKGIELRGCSNVDMMLETIIASCFRETCSHKFDLCGLVSSAEGALRYRAFDWSSLLVSERNGVIYKDVNGVAQPLEQILVASGVNMVRQRVWTTEGDYGIQYNLELAARAQSAGLQFGLNLHYSDTWTNPGLQDIPSGWPTQISELSTKLYQYTYQVCQTFADAGLVPETITIGNEINGGTLWPTGKYDQPHNLATLLHTASRAIRDSGLSPPPKIQVHLSHGENAEEMQWFYDLVLGEGPFTLSDVDMLGVSFYPFWGQAATQENLLASLNNLVTRYGKEVMVIETNWPVSCVNGDYPFPLDTADITFDPAGQTTWIQRTAATLNKVQGARAVGLSYWEGAWIHNAVLGSSCDWNTLFDGNAQAYTSMAVFGTI